MSANVIRISLFHGAEVGISIDLEFPKIGDALDAFMAAVKQIAHDDSYQQVVAEINAARNTRIQ